MKITINLLLFLIKFCKVLKHQNKNGLRNEKYKIILLYLYYYNGTLHERVDRYTKYCNR